jgi:aspartate-semialdehyde dehydrogenase
VVPSDIKEKLIRLESENKQLREGGGDSRVITLMDELDMAKRTSKAHEDKYLKAQLKVIDLESAMKRAQQAPIQSTPITPAANPQEEIDRLREEVRQLSSALAYVVVVITFIIKPLCSQ